MHLGSGRCDRLYCCVSPAERDPAEAPDGSQSSVSRLATCLTAAPKHIWSVITIFICNRTNASCNLSFLLIGIYVHQHLANVHFVSAFRTMCELSASMSAFDPWLCCMCDYWLFFCRKPLFGLFLHTYALACYHVPQYHVFPMYLFVSFI